jgi:hypothetical protein
MRRIARLGVVTAVVPFMSAALVSQAQTRPDYYKAFIAQYENVKEAKDAKCAICHPGKDKKERNNYGRALCKILGAENVKEEAKIREALKKTESEKSAVAGKFFGDLLKEGKLPASK